MKSRSITGRLRGGALALILSAFGALGAGAAVPDPTAAGLSDGERLEVLLARVQHEQQELQTLKARFVMRQESELLLEPETSEGEFFYRAPDRVRWEYEAPNPITVIIREGEMLTWYRDLERAERAKVGKYSDRILKYMSASSSLDDLLEYFDARVSFEKVGTAPYRIELTPSFDRIAKRMKRMVLWIDPQLYLPTRVRIETADGDVNEFTFEDLEVDSPIGAERFDTRLPAGVEVKTIDLSQGAGR